MPRSLEKLSEKEDLSNTQHEERKSGLDQTINERMRSNEDFTNDMERNWYELRPAGTQPERRSNHTSFVHEDRMYIYGGHDIREGELDNLWFFELDKMGSLRELADNSPGPDRFDRFAWQKVETTGNGPGPISHHATVVSGNKMVLIGGSCVNNSKVYSLDLKSFKWECFSTSGYQKEKDHIPESLDEHTACPYGDLIITFGGFVGGERSNLVHSYDVK